MKLSTADAVVIGGGIIGTSITYYLAKMGIKVELVERGNIASGTSSSCADALALQSKAPGPKLAMASRSVQLYHGLSEELDYDLEFRNEGGMIAALDEAQLEYVTGLVEKLRAGGVPVELLDGKAAREMQPALTPRALGSSYCALDCHINPLRVSAGFARAAARKGVRIHLGTEVTGIEVQNGRVTAVNTNRGSIETPMVVDAAGAWSPAIAGMVGIELDIRPATRPDTGDRGPPAHSSRPPFRRSLPHEQAGQAYQWGRGGKRLSFRHGVGAAGERQLPYRRDQRVRRLRPVHHLRWDIRPGATGG